MERENRRRIRDRVNAATPGPWRFAESHGRDCIWMDVVAGETDVEILNGETLPQPSIVHAAHRHQCAVEKEQVEADLQFVAHAREDIPLLLDALDTLEAEIRKLKSEAVS